MKSISIKIIALLAIILVSITSFANQGTKLTIDQRATQRVQKINLICTLTTQQQFQLKQLYVNAFNNRQAAEAAKGKKVKGTTKNKETSRATKKQNSVSLNSILTPAQLSKLKAYRQSKR
jgi:hypothetical protein